MNAINIQLAGHVFEIISEYRISPNLFVGFRTESKPESSVIITDEDIDFTVPERYGINKYGVKMYRILNKVTDNLIKYNVLLMHGAVVALGDKCYMFSGPSGTGKSTHIINWLNHLPGAYVVNGDKPFISFPDDGSQPLAWGSPWAGKENLYTNTMVPLIAIICMERSDENRMEEISFVDAFPFLLQQTYRPEDEEKMRYTLSLLQKLNSKVRFYKFHCNNFKDDCFNVAYHTLVGNDIYKSPGTIPSYPR